MVLAIGAHPDDIEIGVGGKLLSHRARGDTVAVLIMSGGERGGLRRGRDVIARLSATCIYTHSAQDRHQDHRNTHRAVVIAARNVPGP